MARTFSSPAAFRQALESRLKTFAEQRAVPLNTLRLKFLIERLLARLLARPNPPWLLKGGYAMELRYHPKARTTKDIDLTVSGDERTADNEDRLERIRDELQAAADIDLGDYLHFRISASRTELAGAPQGGARFPVQALMAGRLFGSFHIDVGIGDTVHGTPDRLQGEGSAIPVERVPGRCSPRLYFTIRTGLADLRRTPGDRRDQVLCIQRPGHYIGHSYPARGILTLAYREMLPGRKGVARVGSLRGQAIPRHSAASYSDRDQPSLSGENEVETGPSCRRARGKKVRHFRNFDERPRSPYRRDNSPAKPDERCLPRLLNA